VLPATTDAVEREAMSLYKTHPKRLRKRDTIPPHGEGGTGYSSVVSLRTSRPALPFDATTVGEEIERLRVRLGISVADITERLKMPRTLWYKKIAGSPPFRWDEAARIAVEFQAPRGWPVVPFDEGRAWERWLENGGRP
jgi:hypothetical protein